VAAADTSRAVDDPESPSGTPDLHIVVARTNTTQDANRVILLLSMSASNQGDEKFDSDRTVVVKPRGTTTLYEQEMDWISPILPNWILNAEIKFDVSAKVLSPDTHSRADRWSPCSTNLDAEGVKRAVGSDYDGKLEQAGRAREGNHYRMCL
jgi:hypothetical protein